MNKTLVDIIMHPIRDRVIQCLLHKHTANTKEISNDLNDVPIATLYRHIRLLEEHNVIKITSQHKKRGTIEKVYALNEDVLNQTKSIPDAPQNTWDFLMNLYQDFRTYFDQDSVNPQADSVFLKSISLYVTQKEQEEFWADINEVVSKYSSVGPHKDAVLRKMAFISPPPFQQQKKGDD